MYEYLCMWYGIEIALLQPLDWGIVKLEDNNTCVALTEADTY